MNCPDRLKDSFLSRILEASKSAPSGDNTQPVRYRVDEASRTIALVIDTSRDPSPMNSGQRMARMAAGAALENLVRAAQSFGFRVEPISSRGEAVAEVQLVGSPTGTGPGLDSIPARVTNRRTYDGKPVADGVLARLALGSPPVSGVSTHWIVGRDRLEAFAELIGGADALMFGEPSMRQAFLGSVRFDQPPGALVDEGLSLDSIEATPPERLALRVMKGLPDPLLKLGNVARVFAAKARQLVLSASGLCLVVAPDEQDATDLQVGRSFQKAWLALSEEGLAAQPMMSLVVLENVEERGESVLKSRLGMDRLAAFRREFRRLAPEIGEGRPAWLMRFGHAPSPTGRSGRLPLELVIKR